MEVIHKKTWKYHQNPTKRRIIVRVRDTMYIKAFSEIVAFIGEGNYTSICLSNGSKILSSKTLHYYENLVDRQFYRIHKSHMVNMNFIKTVSLSDSQVLLSTDLSLPISRSRKKGFKMHCESCYLGG